MDGDLHKHRLINARPYVIKGKFSSYGQLICCYFIVKKRLGLFRVTHHLLITSSLAGLLITALSILERRSFFDTDSLLSRLSLA